MPSRYLLSESSAAIVRGLAAERGGVAFAERRIAHQGGASGGGGSAAIPAIVTGPALPTVPWTVTVDLYANGLGAARTATGVSVAVLPMSRASTPPAGTIVLAQSVPLVSGEAGPVV